VPLEPDPAAEEGGLQGLRPGRLPGWADRLHVADLVLQEAQLRDLPLRSDPARLHDALEAGRAAGLHEDVQDRAAGEDRALPVADLRVGQAWPVPVQRRLLDASLPLQV